MRISLLLQREPLGEVMEKTLAGFWQSQYGQPYQVHWCQQRPDLKAMGRRGEQAWLGNIYLNAIFTPDADRAVFDPIRREFARSLVRWRRPLQRAYVALATSQRGALRLAQAGLGVSPAVPDGRNKLIVAGNHKLRLLEPQAGLAYGILKAGFGAGFMQRELEARRQAEALGLPVPPLERVAADGTWFSERYISGTPINRLADPQAGGAAAGAAAKALIRLLRHTLAEEDLDEYLAGLRGRIEAMVDCNHLLSAPEKQGLLDTTQALARQSAGLRPAAGGRIFTALTHGDFQPANMLRDGQGVWLTDWEYAARRHVGYDALVFTLRARFPHGLAGRLARFVRQGPDEDASIHQVDWPGLDWRLPARRRLSAWLFLLEELELHLAENAQPPFIRPGAGLRQLAEEINHWLSTPPNDL